jgi:hypothetical protein
MDVVAFALTINTQIEGAVFVAEPTLDELSFFFVVIKALDTPPVTDLIVAVSKIDTLPNFV